MAGMMDLFTLAGSIAIKDNASESIDQVTGKAEKSGGSINKALGKIGSVVVGAFAVEKVIEFGKGMIEATANVQALDSQFQQTFKGDMANKAMEEINKQAQSQNINVDRLKGAWSSFYGTFRGGGADQQKSLELTSKYMSVAGDASAYYDQSLEDVNGRLKSLVMGNFEAGDAIGVNLNATKMDIAAKKEYKKAWADLTDTEKSNLTIDTVSKIYESNGAMGQGAREANNWSNVLGNLKASWDRFLSIIGAPVLSVAVTIVKGLGDAVTIAGASLENMNISGWISGFIEGNPTLQGFVDKINNVKDLFLSASEWSSGPLETLKAMLTEAFGEGTANSIMNFVQTVINTFTTLRDNAQPIFDGLRIAFQLNWELIQGVWNNIGAPLFGFVMNVVGQVLQTFQTAFPIMANIYRGAMETMQLLWNQILKPVLDAIGWVLTNLLIPIWEGEFHVFMSVVQNAFQQIGNFWNNSLKPILDGIINFIHGVFTGNWSQAWSGITSILSGIWNGIGDILWYPISYFLSIISGIGDAISQPFRDAVNWIGDAWSGLRSMFKLPHFSFSGSMNPVEWAKGNTPSIGVDWYAKGAIFTQPTILGNMGVGDANNGKGSNPEAILPIDRLPELLRGTGIGGINIKIDNFNNTRGQDVEDFADELAFYMKRKGLITT